MRVISFCAEGIEQAAGKGFFDWMAEQEADVICIQDIRCEEYKLRDDCYFPSAYNAYFFDNPEGTNGVAVYCKELPKAIMTGQGFTDFDMEARYMQADFERISFGSLLAPSATLGDDKSIARKTQFFQQLHDHLAKIRHKRREFVICGNFQIAHQKKDVQNAAAHEQTLGFTDVERGWMDQMLMDLGYVDAFRAAISDDDEFSWWPDGKIGENGWRVDYQIVSEGLRKSIEYASILKSRSFSNHAPVTVDYDYEINPDASMPRY
ncbi:MAG: endonuclease/exonuclease/phosphatase family protein [Gammaproteobacteria bacterium]|nr:endonuclease/exonuclease/phosphatase family protein [Gammaproteobacteria bacterium]NND38924.1 exodeoxyribonuclease III [Pseudomonadales bacterium]RZV56380.1 MAG: exodeoxyribonuclease III [Pseudomonadales bacterium]